MLAFPPQQPPRTLISSGSPNVYQLKTKTEKFASSTRVTLGDKNENQTNQTILLVGETGAGKSTLINALVNYAIGVKFEDDVWFQIVEEEERRNQTESQTSEVIIYQIFGLEGQTLPFSLTIIDTPGFGDTRGLERDDSVSRRLLDLFRSEDGVHEINAVGLVMKASDNRLSDRLMYVLNSVTSLFGKDLEESIVALITHSDGRNPKNALQALKAANVKSSENEIIHFLFNNCQHEDRRNHREFLELANQISIKGLKNFMIFLESTKPQTLEITAEVLNERIRLTACIQNLQDRIKENELKQREIRQTEEAFENHEEEMKENQNFTIEVDEVYKEKETIKGGMRLFVLYEGAVTCSVCEENCHHPGCTIAWYPEHCEVMKGGRCTVCTNKCPAADHVKEKWRYVIKTRKVQKTLEDLKEKYENNKEECEEKSSLLENLKQENRNLEIEWASLLDEAYEHVMKLEQIALKVESGSTLVHLDFLIEKMKEKGDLGKVKRLEEMKSRENEGTKAALRYAKNLSSE
uniref:Septin-type G domain-containing protein n=1 Tax=Cyprinodon variegatus TaxID=28743 RepID=A0A3Q2DVX8_CYPVA